MKEILHICFVLMLGACSTKPHVIEVSDHSPDTTILSIYIVSHGWHTGIVVPALDVYEKLPQLEERFGQTPYLEFGWGDQDFYQAAEGTLGLAVKALFWRTDTVVHVVKAPKQPRHYFPASAIVEICLKANEYEALKKYLVTSFY